MKESDIYQSGGCTFYPDCLNCPFPECLIDAYPSVLSELRKVGARELARQGKSVNKIAEGLGVSRRQVANYLKDLEIELLTKP